MTKFIQEAFANKYNTSLLGHKLNFIESASKTILENNIEGDIVECGVYKGGSARLLATIFPNKKIYLFDSFEGMLENDTLESGHHIKGDFNDTSLESVKEYLSDKNNCLFYRGWLPESANFLSDEIFSLVHVDLDLYQSTKSAIEIFWPRLSNGGMMIFDDVNWTPCPGVDIAIQEFFQNIKHTKYDYQNMCAIKKS